MAGGTQHSLSAGQIASTWNRVSGFSPEARFFSRLGRFPLPAPSSWEEGPSERRPSLLGSGHRAPRRGSDLHVIVGHREGGRRAATPYPCMMLPSSATAMRSLSVEPYPKGRSTVPCARGRRRAGRAGAAVDARFLVRADATAQDIARSFFVHESARDFAAAIAGS